MAALPRKLLRLLPYAAPQWPQLAVIIALSIAVAATAALQPWPLKLLVDHALGSQPLPDALQRWLAGAGIGSVAATLVAVAALATLAVFALEAAIDAVLTLAWARAGQRMVYTLAGDLFQQLQRLSLGYHARRTVGDSLTRVTGDAWCVQTVVDSLLVTPARQLMVLVSVGLLAWQLDPGLTLLMVVGTPLLAASALYFGRLMRQSERRTREAGSRLVAFVHQVLGAMPLVQVYGAAGRNRQLFAELAGESVSATRAAAQRVQAYALVNGIATTAGIALVVWFGGRQVMAGSMTVGALLVFIAYVRLLDNAARSLLDTYGQLRATEAGVDRVLEVLDAQDKVADAHDALPLPPRRTDSGRGHLVFDDVTVGHEPGRPVLRGLSLELRAGETLALVGSSGAGKTTLASLALRLVDPWHGRVLIDGQDLRRTKLASLRSEVATVLQDPFILPLSVADNIAYGRPDARQEEIVAAAVAAHADGFVGKLAAGYDTVLGEGGAELSGGQRQRIAIARALLKNPRLLILDEPTSALDTETESLVMSALAQLMRGRTTLVIAHRLATVRYADRIAVIDDGVVVEIGSHDELMARGGHYARAVAAGPRLVTAAGAVTPGDPR